MNSFNVFYSIYDQRESAPVCTLAYASHSFSQILSLCWIHKFIYEFDNNRNVYGSVRFYPNATNSYQHVNRKQKHGLFPQRRRKKGKGQRQSEEIFFTLLTSVNKRASDRAEKNIEKQRKQENSLSFGLVERARSSKNGSNKQRLRFERTHSIRM